MIKNKIQILWMISILISCATTKNNSENASESQTSKSDDGGEDDDISLSKSFSNLTYSYRYGGLTSKGVSRNKAKSLITQLNTQLTNTKKDVKPLATIVSLQNVGRDGYDNALERAKQLQGELIKIDIKKDIPEYTNVELALSALQEKKYGAVEYFLGRANDSKNPIVKASIKNIRGVMAYDDGKLPEAADFWAKALADDSEYEAAK